ncbi:hypothetical protein KP509_14G065100 [Ceratopteris richardii]|uniref:Aspartyl aminopeptidase n=1 Tax=Ceratopteris richardii TaxID=49495 RepID=A0A8T2TAP0_CERRI|nr:hypothetical protein KP509_14G065100 [Ceratopteris richardii]
MDEINSAVAEELVSFLNDVPTPFHAVHEAKSLLKAAGYEQISERSDWHLTKGGKYFFTCNHSTIIAFAIGKLYEPGNGFMIVGAHTDSPCPKLKPISKVNKAGFLEVGVQTYGGGLWHTWFDRDLTVAGRVMLKHGNGERNSFFHELVRIGRVILRIPTLAIHLNRTVNEGFKLNTQTHLAPILATAVKDEFNKLTGAKMENLSIEVNASKTSAKSPSNAHHNLLLQLLAEELKCEPEEICDFELQLCDTQPSLIGGGL